MSRSALYALILLLLVLPLFVSASTTSGTIDPAHSYAWGENLGWVNFAASSSNVTVADAGLAGYVWTQNYGWINLNPSQGGVRNDGEGDLSGYAWGENVGWINFDGVVINNAGKFTGTIGSATGTAGRITFDCDNCAVGTDWRPQSVRNGSYSDTTPPSVPQSFEAIPVSSSEIDLSWAASTDNTSVAGYQVFRNGLQVATTTSLLYADTGLSASTQYSYVVTAFDAAGNISNQSSLVEATTQIVSSGGGGGENSGGGSSVSTFGGGGGGGGDYYIAPTSTTSMGTSTISGSTTDLASLLNTLLAQLKLLVAEINAKLIPQLTRNLTVGMSGNDVKALQAFLNDNGYKIASTGPGSQGNEILYFGQKTASALAKFQKANNLPMTGYLGTMTRSFLYSIIGNSIPTSSAPVAVATPPVAAFRILSYGDSGPRVAALQNILIQDGYLRGPATGDFDTTTLRGVQLYQCSMQIVCSGGAGYGTVGARTRTSLGM